MQVVLPDIETRATFLVQSERPMDDDQFFDFCMTNAELRIERSAHGEIIIMPRAGFETGYRNNDVSRQLGNFVFTAFGLSVGEVSSMTKSGHNDGPNGSSKPRMHPESGLPRCAANIRCWSPAQSRGHRPWPEFTKDEKKRFLEMREWIENGAELGWLIDADRRTVHIYRAGQEPEEAIGVNSLVSDGPVHGFQLDLEDVWRGL